MPASHVAVEQHDLESGVVLKEGPEKIQLIPGAPLPDPGGRILKGIEDVVKMNKNAGTQSRQDLEQQVIDVAADFRHVRRIDEEEVVGVERVEGVEGHFLNRPRNQMGGF